jgi:MFS family permease
MTDLQEPPRVPCCKIEVRRGITLLNLGTFFYAAMTNIIALSFINAALPYLLANFLHLKENEGVRHGDPFMTLSGNVTGTVLMWNEIVVILSSSLWGISSDYLGRKPIYVIGFFLIGARSFLRTILRPNLLSLMIHPLVTTVTELILIRVVFALGASATTSMLTSLLGDYPADETRGRTAGLMGLMAGVGALIGVFFFLRLPSWTNGGPRVDGQIMYWATGGTILVSASILFCGLSDNIVESNKVGSSSTLFSLLFPLPSLSHLFFPFPSSIFLHSSSSLLLAACLTVLFSILLSSPRSKKVSPLRRIPG